MLLNYTTGTQENETDMLMLTNFFYLIRGSKD
jgi:hypothetical protein